MTRAPTATRSARRRWRGACRASRRWRARPRRCTRSRPRGRSGRLPPGADRCRDAHGVASVPAPSAVGPYTLLRLERGGIEPGVPGQFFMLEAPGRLLPRPFSLCLAPPGELAFLVDPIGPGTEALCGLGPATRSRARAARATATGSTSSGRCSSAAGSASRRCPYLAEQLGGSPPVVLGFRSDGARRGGRAPPGAEVVVDPVLVTELIDPGFDVLACGPEPMLHAVAALCPSRSSRGRRRWRAATAPVTAASSRSTASSSGSASGAGAARVDAACGWPQRERLPRRARRARGRTAARRRS